MATIKKCRCGESYSPKQWAALQLVGFDRHPELLAWGVREHELRNCSRCLSTIAIRRLRWWRRLLIVAGVLAAGVLVAWPLDLAVHASPLVTLGLIVAVIGVASIAAWRYGLLALLVGGCGGDAFSAARADALHPDASADDGRDMPDVGQLDVADAGQDAHDAAQDTATALDTGAGDVGTLDAADASDGAPEAEAGAVSWQVHYQATGGPDQTTFARSGVLPTGSYAGDCNGMSQTGTVLPTSGGYAFTPQPGCVETTADPCISCVTEMCPSGTTVPLAPAGAMSWQGACGGYTVTLSAH